MNKGTISQVIGPVVDVKFEKDLPAIFNALEIEMISSKTQNPHPDPLPKGEGAKTKLTLEVQQQLPGGIVRTISMSSTDGLKRGMEVTDTGAGISVPVGKVTLGRIFNVLGEAVDGKPTPVSEKKYTIHRPSPKFTDQSTKTEILETGIKVIELICPIL